jgi:hypothetical protein
MKTAKKYWWVLALALLGLALLYKNGLSIASGNLDTALEGAGS